TTFAGIGTTLYLQQRQARAARVDLALSEATLLRDQARAAGADLERWDAASEAIERAELALGEGGDARARSKLDELRRERRAATAGLRRDRELLATLAENRSIFFEVGPVESDRTTVEAFRRAGLDVDALTPAEAAARIKARPAPVVLQIAGALDWWHWL